MNKWIRPKNKRIFYGSRLKYKRKLGALKARFLNFNVENNFNEKSFFSRKTYVQEIIDKKKIT